MPQNYKYAEYPFLGLVFGVIECPDGQVVTTNMALAAALGTDPNYLHINYREHPESFSPIRLCQTTPSELYELLQEHRERFMVRRLKKDLVLWTEEDIYMHCRYSQSPRADEFMRHNVRFLREWRIANVPLLGISPERFAQLESDNGELRQQIKDLTTRFDKLTAHPPIDGTAQVKFTLN